MNQKEITERLALISALSEDIQERLKDMIASFLLYGIAIPVGTFASYLLGRAGYVRLIWVLWLVIMGGCAVFLSVYNRIRAIKIKRATDRIFALLWMGVSVGIIATIMLSFLGKIGFNAAFFNIGLLNSLGCLTTAALIQQRMRLFLYIETLCWFLCGTLCLFVPKYTAPLLIGAATFILCAVPALTALIIIKRRQKDA